MASSKSLSSLLSCCISATAAFRVLTSFSAVGIAGTAVSLHAQQAATGTIKGRVLNATNGMYLSKAVVTVEGTSLQTLTNDFGEYELRNVPAGAVKLTVTFTGQQPVVTPVTVESGKTSENDVSLGTAVTRTANDGALVLNEYVVESKRYRSAQEIAANEERNSTNIKNVVAADSLGYVQDGNIAEFVKFLPGIDLEYGGDYVNPNDASGIGVRGFGAENTSIMIDGMPVSSASPASLTRAIGMDMLSINNASRIEVIKVPTPDMANDSPGGAINLVTRSAFEFARPTINLDLTVSGNTMQPKVFEKSPGPGPESTFHTLPGLRFSIAMPLSKTLGVSASLSSDNKYSSSESYVGRWRMANQTVNLTPIGGSASAQISNAKGRVDLSNPSLERIQITDSPWNTFRQSGNFKIDWRPFPGLGINTNVQYSRYTGLNVDRRIQFTLNAAQDWGPDYVRGYQRTAFNPSHSTQMDVTSRDKEGETFSGYFKFNFKKGPWSVDGNFNHSESYGHFEDQKNGHFSAVSLALQTGRIDYYGIKDAVPQTVAVWNNAGTPIDYTRLDNWTTNSALDVLSGSTRQRDIQANYNLNLRYELDFMPFPSSVKIGGARSIKDARKWGNGTNFRMRYTGPTLAWTQIVDEYKSGPIFGLAGSQEWASVHKLYDLYRARPDYFNADFDVATSINNYNNSISQRKSIKETSDSTYAMVDAQFFRNRLKLLTGVRQKEKNIEGFQPYVESKFNYVRLPNGLVYTDSIYIQGVKYDGSTGPRSVGGNYARDAVLTDTALIARMQAAGAIIPTQLELAPDGIANGSSSNNLKLAKERYKHRTIDQKRKDPPTPQVQIAYEITDNLQIKLAWSRETKLPNLESGTTGGLLTSGNSLAIDPNLNSTNSGIPGEDGTITISNPSLEPELTNSWNGELSYYTKSGGKVSVGYFYKQVSNLWDDVEVYNDSPDYAEILSSFGLNPIEYDNWKLNSTINTAKKAKRTGVEVSINQSLDMLGRWAKGLDMFATYSHRPNAASDTPSNPPRGYLVKLPARDKYSAGLSYSMLRFTMQARATLTESGISRGSTVAYTAPGETTGSLYQLYNMLPSDLRMNLQANYKISRRYSTFVTAQNVLQSHTSRKVSDVMTKIMPDYAHYTQQSHKGVAITAGVSGSF